MKMKILLISVALFFVLTGCRSKYYYSMGVGMNKVEAPISLKENLSKSEVHTFEYEKGPSVFHFTDKNITVSWILHSKDFGMVLKNNTDQTIKIKWQDVVFEHCFNMPSRVLPNEVAYSERFDYTKETLIPKGASIVQNLTPVSLIYYMPIMNIGWTSSDIYDIDDDDWGKTKEQLNKPMKIILPITVGEVTNTYVFEFTAFEIIRHDRKVEKKIQKQQEREEEAKKRAENKEFEESFN